MYPPWSQAKYIPIRVRLAEYVRTHVLLIVVLQVMIVMILIVCFASPVVVNDRFRGCSYAFVVPVVLVGKAFRTVYRYVLSAAFTLFPLL